MKKLIATFRARADEWEIYPNKIGPIIADELRIMLDAIETNFPASSDAEETPPVAKSLAVESPALTGVLDSMATGGEAPARAYADCDCEEQIPSDEYGCEKCQSSVTICGDCYAIIVGCGCGHCEEGKVFRESD